MSMWFNWPFPERPSFWYKRKSYFMLRVVPALSKLWIGGLNNVQSKNVDTLLNAINKCECDRKPLVTVGNHYSNADDPFMWVVLPWRMLMLKPYLFRYIPTAQDIVFTRKIYVCGFSLGRCVPIVRGAGVYQRGMDYVGQRLEEGGWAHLFPEGKVNLDKSEMRYKWGVGRLISECSQTPTVIPVFSLGLDEVLPQKKLLNILYFPRIRKKVSILVGDDISYNIDVMRGKLREQKASAMEQRKAITDYIQTEMDLLKQKAYQFHDSRD